MSRVAFAASILFLAAAARADTVTLYFTGLPATFQSNSYNGYASAIVNGILNQLLICDYYYGETYVPSPVTMVYDYSTLTGPNPLQYAMWDTSTPPGAADIQKYDQAAVLLYQLAQMGAGASGATITDFQYALWNLMDPTAPYASGRSAQEQSVQAAALAQVIDPSQQTFLSANVYPAMQIYTPTAPFKGNQEFLAYTPLSTPEPSTAIGVASLVLAGLIAKPLHRRVRRRHLISGVGIRTHIERITQADTNGL